MGPEAQKIISGKRGCRFPVFTCGELLTIQPTPDNFIIKPLIPEGMVSALTSQAGTGKSLIALEMARCVASGKPFLDKFEIPHGMPVLLLDQEMSLNTVVSRFHSMIDDPSLPIYVGCETALKITNPDDYRNICDVITKEKIGLVIFDTLVTFHSGDENQVAEMREVMEALMKLCNEMSVTVLFLHHQRKGAYGEQASQASMRGSTEIAAKIGSQMTLEGKEKVFDEDAGQTTATLTMEQHKSRLPSGFKKFTITSVYNEKTGKTLFTYSGDCEDKKLAKAAALKDEIRDAVSSSQDGKLSRQEIIAKLSGSKMGGAKKVDSALKELVAEGEVAEESQPGTKAHLYSIAQSDDSKTSEAE